MRAASTTDAAMRSVLHFTPLTKRLRSHIAGLKKKAFREECGELALEGARLIGDALGSGVPIIRAVVEEGKKGRYAPILERLSGGDVPLHECTTRDMELMTDTEHAQGILATASWRPATLSEAFERGVKSSIAVALHAAADPGNLGTIIRTCDWFGVPSIFISRGSVDPSNPKVVRSSMGGVFRVAIAEYQEEEELYSEARARGYRIVATSGSAGTPVGRTDRSGKTLFVFGGEARGLPDAMIEAADEVIHIPGKGGAESLNLAVAHGIVMAMSVKSEK
jgi:RNA methyltransferase, TrmH family